MQEESQKQRISMEKEKGTADMQCELAKSQVDININENKAKARKAEADGESEYIEKTGHAQGAKVKAVGMAKAESYRAQVEALGQNQTAYVNIATALAEGKSKFVPEVLVTSSGDSGSLDALLGSLCKKFSQKPLVPKPDKAA